MKVTVELREQVQDGAPPRIMSFTDVTSVEVNAASDLKIYKGSEVKELHAFFPNGSYQYFTREEDDTA